MLCMYIGKGGKCFQFKKKKNLRRVFGGTINSLIYFVYIGMHILMFHHNLKKTRLISLDVPLIRCAKEEKLIWRDLNQLSICSSFFFSLFTSKSIIRKNISLWCAPSQAKRNLMCAVARSFTRSYMVCL